MIRALATKRFNRSLTVRPDDQLIAAVLAGDTADFAELAARYRDRVERLCQRFFADREMVRDLSQESFFERLLAFLHTAPSCRLLAGCARLSPMSVMTNCAAVSEGPKNWSRISAHPSEPGCNS
jgi:hypothetical protein